MPSLSILNYNTQTTTSFTAATTGSFTTIATLSHTPKLGALVTHSFFNSYINMLSGTTIDMELRLYKNSSVVLWLVPFKFSETEVNLPSACLNCSEVLLTGGSANTYELQGRVITGTSINLVQGGSGTKTYAVNEFIPPMI